MTRVGVVGATGYAGAELVRILSGHPDVELTIITSRQYSGEMFDSIYPSMAGSVNLVCEEFVADHVCGNADVIFMALPHKLPMELVPGLIKQGKKVIDLSADFRFRDAAKYEAYYQPHTATDLLGRSVYGLCEIYYERIKKASLIGNPGCYPTSVLLPLIPMVKNKLIDIHTIIADSKSGVSGAGKTPNPITHFCNVNENAFAYNPFKHRHAPEVKEKIQILKDKNFHINFVPHLLPITRGMLVSVYATLKEEVNPSEILRDAYSNSEFVRIKDVPADIKSTSGTNFCDIYAASNGKALFVSSSIDNLLRGASSQAVVNANIMCGYDEGLGIPKIAYVP